MKEIVTKKENGEYILTDYGEFTAYFYAIQKLLIHYMQNGLKLHINEVKQKNAKLKAFVDKNFNNLDDYLEKLPLLAQYIGEKNESRFISYISSQFIGVLEKVQKQLFEKELPKAKARYDNPYRSPGNEFLDEFEDLFRKAPALIWPPLKKSDSSENTNSNTPSVIVEETKNIKLPGEYFLEQMAETFLKSRQLVWPVEKKNNLDENNTSAEKIEVDNKDSNKLPGEYFLEKYAEEFSGSKALVWPIPKTGLADPSDNEKNIETTIDSSAPDKLPGELFLEQFAQLFLESKTLVLKTNSQENEIAVKNELPIQIQLKEYAQILNAIQKFTKAKDNKGYQLWGAKLNPKQKACIQINTLINKEQQGQTIDYYKLLQELSLKLGVMIDELNKIKEEIIIYKKILTKIRQTLQKAITLGGDKIVIQKLYPQFISLIENKDSLSAVHTALKMMLLQVTNKEAKTFLNEEIKQIIDEYREKIFIQ